MTKAKAALIKTVLKLSSIPEEEALDFANRFTSKTLTKGAFLLRAGEPALLAGFVSKGVVREYFSNKEAREFNKNFAFPGDFTGSYHDLISQTPSTVSIQAMAKTELLVAPFQEILEIFDSSLHWQRFARKFIENLFHKKARREYQLTCMSAQERYKALVKESPEILNQIPHYEVASYLAITPVALSRIRKRIGVTA